MAFTFYALLSRSGQLVKHELADEDLLALLERAEGYDYGSGAFTMALETTEAGTGEITLAEANGTTVAEIPLRDRDEVAEVIGAIAAAIRASKDPLINSLTVTPGIRHRSTSADTN